MTKRSPKLLDQVRAIMRGKHYSLRTEQTYLRWIKQTAAIDLMDKIAFENFRSL